MPEADATDLPYGVPVTDSCGQTVLHPSRDEYHDVVEVLHTEGYAMCVDLTAVDYLGSDCRSLPAGVAPERFEVVAGFLDLEERRRVRLRIQLGGDEPSIATLTDLYPGVEALEREVYDMFGIIFEGHRDLTRILMPEDWDGFPLRKDYDVGSIPVQFKAADRVGRMS